MTWCGKVYSSEGPTHLPGCIEGLVSTYRPATEEKPAHIVQAVNKIISLPRRAELVGLLRELLEVLLARTASPRDLRIMG